MIINVAPINISAPTNTNAPAAPIKKNK